MFQDFNNLLTTTFIAMNKSISVKPMLSQTKINQGRVEQPCFCQMEFSNRKTGYET